MYDWLIFDVGGTLMGFTSPRPFRQFLQSLYDGREVTANEGRVFWQRWNSIVLETRAEARGKGAKAAELERFWESVIAQAAAQLPSGAAARLKEVFYRGDLQDLFPDVRPTLRALHRRGVPMGIVSNFGEDLEDYLRRWRIRSYFRFVIVSSRVGLAKPDPAIFGLAAQKAGVAPGRCLYVGDDPGDDCQGARAAGMGIVLVDRDGTLSESACPLAPDLRAIEQMI